MPPSVPMTKSGQRDSLIQILWSNLLKTRIPIPASVLLAMCPSRQEQSNAIQNALSDALHQRLLTSIQQRGGDSSIGGNNGRNDSSGSSDQGVGRNSGIGGPAAEITPLVGASPHAGTDPNIPPPPHTTQIDPHFNQLVDSFFLGGGDYDQLFHQLQQDDLEDWDQPQQHLQIEEQHQQAQKEDIYVWGKEHPALTYSTVEFPSTLRTRAMLDSGSTINTITKEVAEKMGLTTVPKMSQFSTAAGTKEVVGEIATTI